VKREPLAEIPRRENASTTSCQPAHAPPIGRVVRDAAATHTIMQRPPNASRPSVQVRPPPDVRPAGTSNLGFEALPATSKTLLMRFLDSL